jgi:hypothetical protein
MARKYERHEFEVVKRKNILGIIPLPFVKECKLCDYITSNSFLMASKQRIYADSFIAHMFGKETIYDQPEYQSKLERELKNEALILIENCIDGLTKLSDGKVKRIIFSDRDELILKAENIIAYRAILEEIFLNVNMLFERYFIYEDLHLREKDTREIITQNSLAKPKHYRASRL